MSFNDSQNEKLSQKLESSKIKTRSQSGQSFAYLESWYVIDLANQIFGFDGWYRETVFANCVSEKPRKIGSSGADGFEVTYICKVKITVGDVIREGTGAGHGIDRSLGQAHESAIKEAESDAMKRALITFGHQFGLALYDKTRAFVEGDSGSNAQQQSNKSNGYAPKSNGTFNPKALYAAGMKAFASDGTKLSAYLKANGVPTGNTNNVKDKATFDKLMGEFKAMASKQEVDF